MGVPPQSGHSEDKLTMKFVVLLSLVGLLILDEDAVSEASPALQIYQPSVVPVEGYSRVKRAGPKWWEKLKENDYEEVKPLLLVEDLVVVLVQILMEDV